MPDSFKPVLMQLITLQQACDMLQISRTTLWRRINGNPHFPQPVKVGCKSPRLRLSDVEQYLLVGDGYKKFCDSFDGMANVVRVPSLVPLEVVHFLQSRFAELKPDRSALLSGEEKLDDRVQALWLQMLKLSALDECVYVNSGQDAVVRPQRREDARLRSARTGQIATGC